MLIKKIIHSDTGIMILSFLIGLGLATLFKKTCQGNNSIVGTQSNPTCRTLEFRVPENIDGQIFYLGDPQEKPECYRYRSFAVRCPQN